MKTNVPYDVKQKLAAKALLFAIEGKETESELIRSFLLAQRKIFRPRLDRFFPLTLSRKAVRLF